MKFLQRGIFAGPLIGSLLPALLASQVLMQPLLADEPTNVSDIKECRAIAAEAERLLCYDTVADGGVFSQQHLQQVQIENFGSQERQPEISVDQLTVTIVRVQKAANGIHYFYTADGQAWKQSSRSDWSLKVPFQAEIKAGTMGSFFLVNEGGKSTRVKRAQ